MSDTLFAPANPLPNAERARARASPWRRMPCWRGKVATGIGCSKLEADATIPAEYVLLRHYLGEPVDASLKSKIAVYLRRIQGKHDGWPLFHGGDFDMSASVKAYFALKMIGEDIDAPHMRARAGRDPGARRRRRATSSRGSCWLCSASLLAGGSRHACRNHAAAAVVSVSPVQGVILGTHGYRSAAGPAGAQTESAQSEDVGIDELFIQPPRSVGTGPRRRISNGFGSSCFAASMPAPADRAGISQRFAPALHRQGPGLRHRTPQRRGRSGRDFPGDGQLRHDVRRARLSASSIRIMSQRALPSTSCWS